MSSKKFILALVLSFLIILPLQAHDWYPAACCSGSDCHPIPCEEILEKGRNLIYRGYSFYDNMIKPSQDGLCHVCIGNEDKPNYTKIPHCIFTQHNS